MNLRVQNADGSYSLRRHNPTPYPEGHARKGSCTTCGLLIGDPLHVAIEAVDTKLPTLSERIEVALSQMPMDSKQLALHIGYPHSFVRSALAQLVYRDKRVTCDVDGRFRVGDPTALLLAGT